MIKTGDWERKELLITIAVILLPLAVLYFLSFRPRIREISGMRQSLQSVQARLEEASRAIPEVGKYEKESSFVQLETVSMRAKIPREQRIPQLIDELRRFAKEAGIEDLSFSTEKEQLVSFLDEESGADALPPEPDNKKNPPASPGGPPKGEAPKEPEGGEGASSLSLDCYRIPVIIKAKSKYRALAKFLEKIPQSDRLFTISSLNIQRAEEIVPLIRVEIRINAYYLQPQGQEEKRESLRR